MKIASLVKDRKQIVKALEEVTGFTNRYLGAPSFGYEVGPYMVDRAGNISVENPEEEVLAALAAKNLIRRPDEEKPDETATIISLPMESHSGASLKNLIFMLYSKSVLLSKAVGQPGYYRVSEKMINALKEKTPDQTGDVLQILSEIGEEHLQGISFADGKISFFFPYTMDPDRLHAYMQLSELMTKIARDQVRVQPDKCKVTNEKYTFRVWLMHLGMKGEEYKVARKILLKNLSGNSAFRTKDQMDSAKEKLREKRAAEKERADEMAFIEL